MQETQVQCMIFETDIARYADLLHLFHTYLLSVANVKESNSAYDRPIGDFIWIIDRNTIVEPIEKLDPT